ncbi:hypothetical protein A4X09_0g5789 [Tilletia walkeri]|uniref:Uncharacterized protein n=1 Tax=Tilletia walkeri TaxID=117179 RepID=A0A8X7N6R4_9BASI|nr:hypothetical protein A4X09_0g5789 [Tilletia walkeri]
MSSPSAVALLARVALAGRGRSFSCLPPVTNNKSRRQAEAGLTERPVYGCLLSLLLSFQGLAPGGLS